MDGECRIWGTTDVLWKDANWLWSVCGGTPPQPPVVVPIGNLPGVDAETLIQPWRVEEPWNPYKTLSAEKKKKLIKLICKINDYAYSEEKEVGSRDLAVNHVKITINPLASIDVNLKLEE